MGKQLCVIHARPTVGNTEMPQMGKSQKAVTQKVGQSSQLGLTMPLHIGPAKSSEGMQVPADGRSVRKCCLLDVARSVHSQRQTWKHEGGKRYLGESSGNWGVNDQDVG